jgi:hypothetical protein
MARRVGDSRIQLRLLRDFCASQGRREALSSREFQAYSAQININVWRVRMEYPCASVPSY